MASCERSSTLVDGLANVGVNTTRKQGEVVSQSHNCEKKIVSFVAMTSKASTLKIKTKLFTSVLHHICCTK